MDEEQALARDVYAHFGRAYYMTECIHRGLGIAFATLPLDPTMATRPRMQERLKSAEGMTLGELVRLSRDFLPAALHDSLDWALAKRNFLAHGFWYDRIHMMWTAEHKRELIEELSEAGDLLSELDRMIDELVLAHLRRIGIPGEALDTALDRNKTSPPEPLPHRRAPRTDERIEIVEAWVIKNGGIMLRDSSGEMWQLCEVGLGWSYYDQPEDTWKPHPQLSSKLPAKVNARPKGARAWNYKLHVSTGALIRVERDERTGHPVCSVELTAIGA